MKKRYLALLASLLGMFCLLAGCGGNAAPAESEADTDLVVIGFSQVGAESDWRVANTESIRNTFQESMGYELIYSDGQQKQENQITAIRRFILQGVDYILLDPVIQTGWDSVLLEAKEAGIPVILVDRMIEVEDESLYTAYVGSDFYSEGETAMEWLENYLEKQEKAEDPVNIVHIQGTLDSTAQIGRTSALLDAIKQHENWNLTAQVEGCFTQAKSYESMKALLQTTTDFNVVYCENDNMALGAIRALEEAGINPASNDMTIISFDATKPGLAACLKRKIKLDVECNPQQGPKIETVIQMLLSGETPERCYYMETSWFDLYHITQGIVDTRDY